MSRNAQQLCSRAEFCRASRAARDSSFFSSCAPGMYEPVAVRSDNRSVGQHSIGIYPSTAGVHISHDADRLASARVRRAAVARDSRSSGTASPVPKYISSGV
jgi:hypothetical protein